MSLRIVFIQLHVSHPVYPDMIVCVCLGGVV